MHNGRSFVKVKKVDQMKVHGQSFVQVGDARGAPTGYEYNVCNVYNANKYNLQCTMYIS